MNNKIIKQSIKEYGVDSKIELIIEESAELIKALQKYKRYYNKVDFAKDEDLLFDVCDEIADMKIMIETAEIIFDDELINERVNFKIKRLNNKLDGK